MKQDLDIHKAILQKLEEKENPIERLLPDSLEGIPQDKVSYHIYLLDNGGFITGHEEGYAGDKKDPYYWTATGITPEGYKMLAMLSDADFINEVNKKIPGGVAATVTILLDVYPEWTKKRLSD